MEFRLLEDQPEVDATRLGKHFETLAARLAEVIVSLPASSPVLVSGDWGSGKTTLLHAMKKQLPNPTILFEAWHYENEIPLLPALMRAIVNETPEAYRKKQETQKTRACLWRSAIAACAGMGAGLAQVAIGPIGKAVMEGLAAAWKDGDTPKGKPPLALPEEDATEQLWKSFKQLLDDAWPHLSPVILIDDLDRCSPAGAVSLLDSIRLLVARADNNQCRCHFVVALDRSVMAQAVARKFSEISHYDGNRYLEKIFPISFDLPRFDPAALGRFIEQLVEQLDKAPRSGGEDGLSEILSLGLESPIFANPRLVKRCINRFVILSHLDPTDDRSEAQHRRDVMMVRWLAATERWPKLRRLLVRRSPDYWLSVKSALATPGTSLPDAEITELLKEQDLQLWVEREFLAKDEQLVAYQKAEDRLRRCGL